MYWQFYKGGGRVNYSTKQRETNRGFECHWFPYSLSCVSFLFCVGLLITSSIKGGSIWTNSQPDVCARDCTKFHYIPILTVDIGIFLKTIKRGNMPNTPVKSWKTLSSTRRYRTIPSPLMLTGQIKQIKLNVSYTHILFDEDYLIAYFSRLLEPFLTNAADKYLIKKLILNIFGNDEYGE